MVKRPPANAGDTGSVPGWEDSHAMEQLQPHATTLGPQAATPDVRAPRACAPQQEEPPQ